MTSNGLSGTIPAAPALQLLNVGINSFSPDLGSISARCVSLMHIWVWQVFAMALTISFYVAML